MARRMWIVGIIRNGESPEISFVPHGKTANAKFRRYTDALDMLGETFYSVEASSGGGAAITESACYFYTKMNVPVKGESSDDTSEDS